MQADVELCVGRVMQDGLISIKETESLHKESWTDRTFALDPFDSR